jgi:hypothetical protein
MLLSALIVVTFIWWEEPQNNPHHMVNSVPNHEATK